jgi:hypothetical protein
VVTPEHDHDDEDDEEPVDISAWTRSAQTRSCPACGASGALLLGGGLFCPACGEVSTNPGYEAPSEPE